MAREISVAKLKAERRELANRLALLDRVISDLQALAASNGQAQTKRPTQRKVVIRSEGAIPLRPVTIRDIVTKIIEESPGLSVREVVKRVVPHFVDGSADPKKLVSTRIGQFVKIGKLVRRGDLLFLPGQE